MLWGDGLKSSYEFETSPSISSRLGTTQYQLSSNTTGFTDTQVRNKAEAEVEYIEFRKLLDHSIVQLRSIETKLKDKSIPYIKGKDENWKGE